MRYNNSVFGKMAQPFKENPFVQGFETVGNPLPPPTTYFVVTDVGDFVVTDAGDNVVYVVA